MKPVSIVVALLASWAASLSHAESLVDGVYQSAADANGHGQCTLQIRALTQSHKYGDEVFELESSGEGACEWSAIGISKSFAISAGLVTNSGAPAFMKASFPFGPAGNLVEIVTFELDGSIRHTQQLRKLEDFLPTG